MTLDAVEFRDTIKLGAANNQELTLLFAPRGGAAFGLVPYMHRDSAEGNPDSPLGHNMQDGFHDASSVFGLGYHEARTTAEISAFTQPFDSLRPLARMHWRTPGPSGSCWLQ